LLHTKRLYRWHKQHHSVVATFALASEYASDVERLLSNELPVLLPVLLLGRVSFGTLLAWVAVRLLHSYAIHSGYELPWPLHAVLVQCSGAHAHHEIHHFRNIGNFGDSAFWDILMGTCYTEWAVAAGVGSNSPSSAGPRSQDVPEAGVSVAGRRRDSHSLTTPLAAVLMVAAAVAAHAWQHGRPVGQSDVPTLRRFSPTAESCINKGFVAVIGAGPAGLATAAKLLNARVPFVVLEKEAVAGYAWRTRYPRLHLHTVGPSSQLPGWPFPEHFPTYVSASDLAAYYDGYARTILAPHVLYNATVTAAAQTGEGWVLQVAHRSANGAIKRHRFVAAALVVATGQEGTPVLPAIKGLRSFRGKAMHSAAWRGGAEHAGKTSLVVGFGNSGAEIALDLWEQGAANVTVTVRSPINVMPRWLVAIYPHGLGLVRSLLYFERFLAPAWLSDILGSYVIYPLLYSDLPALGLPLSSGGVKSDLLRHHRAPLLDIGTIDLIRRGEIRVENRRIERLTKGGAVYCGAARPGEENVAASCEEVPYDIIIFATGFSKASTAAPHARFLPAELLPRLSTEWGQIESGREVVPTLWFTGFSDYVGRLAEMNWEAEAIAEAIAHDHVQPWDPEVAQSYAHLHRAVYTPAVCIGQSR